MTSSQGMAGISTDEMMTGGMGGEDNVIYVQHLQDWLGRRVVGLEIKE